MKPEASTLGAGRSGSLLPQIRRSRLSAAPLLLVLTACSGAPAATDEPVVFYPEPPDPPRIQFLRTVSIDTDIEPGQSGLDAILFGKPLANRGFMAPYGATVREGIVYVCDIQQGVVLTLDFAGEKLDYVRTRGRGKLQKPVNLDFAADGTLYVVDMGRRQVVVFDPSQEYDQAFGPFDESSRPTDVQVVGERLLIADPGSRCVRILDRTSGEELQRLGTTIGGGKLRAPTNVTVDSEGYVYAADSVDCQIYVWDPSGEPVRVIGSPGDTVGQFARPKGIAFFEDLLFVVDAAFENCQILDLLGEPLMYFGGSGTGPGSMYLPAGVWIGREGLELFENRIEADFEAESLIIVTNLFGPRKVNFYALGRSRGGSEELAELPKASSASAVTEEGAR